MVGGAGAAVEPLRALRVLLEPMPEGLHVELDDGHLLVFRRADMLHLDADALHDRLVVWTRDRLGGALPAASAGLSFRHAAPADPHEASTLDLQEGWLGLEPTFSLDLTRAVGGDVERFASLVPEFLGVVEAEGRPAGYRTPEVGSVE